RWLLHCKECGVRIHSDQAGSRNIMRQNKPSVSWDGAEAAPRTETLRWTRHRWDPRSVDPGRCAKSGVPEFLKAPDGGYKGTPIVHGGEEVSPCCCFSRPKVIGPAGAVTSVAAAAVLRVDGHGFPCRK